MNSSFDFTTAIASQRAAKYIADADNARLAKSLRKTAKRTRHAAAQSAGAASTALHTS